MTDRAKLEAAAIRATLAKLGEPWLRLLDHLSMTPECEEVVAAVEADILRRSSLESKQDSVPGDADGESRCDKCNGSGCSVCDPNDLMLCAECTAREYGRKIGTCRRGLDCIDVRQAHAAGRAEMSAEVRELVLGQCQWLNSVPCPTCDDVPAHEVVNALLAKLPEADDAKPSDQ